MTATPAQALDLARQRVREGQELPPRLALEVLRQLDAANREVSELQRLVRLNLAVPTRTPEPLVTPAPLPLRGRATPITWCGVCGGSFTVGSSECTCT